MTTLTFLLSCGILLAQDSELAQAQRDLQRAIDLADAAALKEVADRLAATDSPGAVDLLFQAYDALAVRARAIAKEEERWQTALDRNSEYRKRVKNGSRWTYKTDQAKWKKYREAQTELRNLGQKLKSLDDMKAAIAQALSRFTSDGAVEKILSTLRRDDSWARRAAAAEILGALERDDVTSELMRALEGEHDAAVKVAILTALRGRDITSSDEIKAIASCVSDPYWQVQVAALECLRKVEPEAGRVAVEALIRALENSETRVRHEINDVLVRLTGVNKHGSHEAWLAWWEDNSHRFAEGTYEPPPAPPPGASTPTTFYGIPIESNRVVFILDRSGSMMQPSEWDIGAPVPTGGKKSPGLEKEGSRKIDIARWQLKLALLGMPDGALFNIIFYNSEVSKKAIFNPRGLVKRPPGAGALVVHTEGRAGGEARAGRGRHDLPPERRPPQRREGPAPGRHRGAHQGDQRLEEGEDPHHRGVLLPRLRFGPGGGVPQEPRRRQRGHVQVADEEEGKRKEGPVEVPPVPLSCASAVSNAFRACPSGEEEAGGRRRLRHRRGAADDSLRRRVRACRRAGAEACLPPRLRRPRRVSAAADACPRSPAGAARGAGRGAPRRRRGARGSC
ncbi:MAG: HEAT repeat domain-containing protein [Planctomycetota bacterium]